jgi:acyl-coenzyme A thioesterase PaaI-like protein
MRMNEVIFNKLRCWSFYAYGCYRGTGGRLKYIAPDWREVKLEVPLSWRTRNYVGTIFGGSMYGAVDPIYMLMLIKLLGPGYIVWDKAGSIQFMKPGRGTLQAHFRISDEEVETIKSALGSQSSVDRTYHVDLVDSSGAICATVEKVIYIRRR